MNQHTYPIFAHIPTGNYSTEPDFDMSEIRGRKLTGKLNHHHQPIIKVKFHYTQANNICVTEEINALIDTGSYYSFVGEKVIESLKAETTGRFLEGILVGGKLEKNQEFQLQIVIPEMSIFGIYPITVGAKEDLFKSDIMAIIGTKFLSSGFKFTFNGKSGDFSLELT